MAHAVLTAPTAPLRPAGCGPPATDKRSLSLTSAQWGTRRGSFPPFCLRHGGRRPDSEPRPGDRLPRRGARAAERTLQAPRRLAWHGAGDPASAPPKATRGVGTEGQPEPQGGGRGARPATSRGPRDSRTPTRPPCRFPISTDVRRHLIR